MRGSLAVGFLIYAVFTACAGHSASGAQPLPALGSLSHVAKICASHLLPGAPVKTVTVGGARRAGEAPPLRSPNKLLKWASPLVGRCLDTCGTGQHCGTGEQAIRDASSASVARSDLPSSDSPVASGQGESSASASRRWLAQAQPAAPNLVELTCDRDEVVPGERVLVRGREEHVFTVPPEAKPGQRIWQKFEGQWIDFTVVPLAEVLTAMDDTTLVLTLTSNMGESATLTVSVMGHSVSLRA
ncbi:MAG: hypothetical protein H5T86_06450, partial [Armatimonadetes bacterium]|nr:hypothetical protein [Armatimonadota bacterium]